MINSNTDCLGIIFPNSYDTLVPELVSERSMASIPFAGRYRLIDFVLSSMVNSGIDNISLIVRSNYHSLMDHLGSGREWDLARKKGGLNIIPPFAQKDTKIYNGMIEAMNSMLSFLRRQKEEYVLITNANIAANFDFRKVIDAHVASEADVTIMYVRRELAADQSKIELVNRDIFYSYELDDAGRITDISINSEEGGLQNLSLKIYVVEREKLISMIHEAYMKGLSYFERDYLLPRLKDLKVMGYELTGYYAYIGDMQTYFDENMRLLKEENLDALFAPAPIYTKIRDDNPTRYVNGSKAKNVMVADGCIIEGEVENSILFRGVYVGKGAKVKNSILMQDTIIGDNVELDYIITDKEVNIASGRKLQGSDTFPVYIEKRKSV